MQAFIPAAHCLFTPHRNQNLCQRSQTSLPSLNHRAPLSIQTTIRQTIHAQDTLFLSEENVNKALDEVRVKLGSVFGNNDDNRAVGITGEVELADLDGPIVVLRLKGRFWHKRADVVSTFTVFDRALTSVHCV